jgi:hypothetical protein
MNWLLTFEGVFFKKGIDERTYLSHISDSTLAIPYKLIRTQLFQIHFTSVLKDISMSSQSPFASRPYHDSKTSAPQIPSSLLENSLSFRTVSIQLKVLQVLVNIFATVFNKKSVDLGRGVFFKQAS